MVHRQSSRATRASEVADKSWAFRRLSKPVSLTTEEKPIYLFSSFLSTDQPVSSNMKIPVEQITPSPKEIMFSEKTEELNSRFAKEKYRDFHFPSLLNGSLVYYRSGQELFFHGSFGGSLEGCCSRCLITYPFDVEKSFDLVLVPEPVRSERKVEELKREELGLSYYSSDVINLAPLIEEQVLLALPTRPLCREDCRGLCSGCGANLNSEECACDPAAPSDSRLAIFRTLKINR